MTPTDPTLKALAEAASTTTITTTKQNKRWSLKQKQILVGVIVFKFICSGKTFTPKQKFLTSIHKLFHVLQILLLKPEERCKRTEKALESKYKTIKNENRIDQEYIKQLYNKFLQLDSLKFLTTHVFMEKQSDLTKLEIETALRISNKIDWNNLDIPVCHNRSNSWTLIENAILVESVVQKLLETGSFCPKKVKSPKEQIKGRAWQRVYKHFNNLKKIITPDEKYITRPRSQVIERHFKNLKEPAEVHKIPAFYLYFKKIENKNHIK